MANEYTVTLNELLKDKLPELPGIVRSVAARELQLAMREFFEKSYAWTKDVTDIAVVQGEAGIQVNPNDANVEVVGVLNVAIGDPSTGFVDLVPLPRRPSDEATGNYPEYWYISSNPDEFIAYPYPDVAITDTYTARVALMPAFTIDPAQQELPRQLIKKYYDAVMQGFLARLYAHPNKPYSAPIEAKALRHNFLRAIGFYAAQRKNGYNGAPNWGYPRGWRK